MTAPGNDLLFLVLALGILLSSSYAIGRIHQWHRQGLERDEAYRVGYDEASIAIIVMMRERKPRGIGPDATAARLATESPALRNGRHVRSHHTSHPARRPQQARTGA